MKTDFTWCYLNVSHWLVCLSVPRFMFIIVIALVSSSTVAQDRGDLIVLIGSSGEAEYQTQFNTWSTQWEAAARQGHVQPLVLGANSQQGASLIELQQALSATQDEKVQPLWLVMIGHGTFDGKSAKFNLFGPDLTPEELASALDKLKRPVAVINCASASGEFIDVLSAPHRVIITATKSGQELNFAHFGEYLAKAISDPNADLDKDQQTSLLEAFLLANRETEEFYKSDGRLATEHALLDDNNDGRGTRGAAFRGVRAVAEPNDESVILDGLRAHQWHLIANDFDQSLPPEVIKRRNELELQLAELRAQKSELAVDEYYDMLEGIFVELAKLVAPKEPTE